jgi:hypothetical protein
MVLDAVQGWNQILAVLVLGELHQFPPDPVVSPEVIIGELYRIHEQRLLGE